MLISKLARASNNRQAQQVAMDGGAGHQSPKHRSPSASKRTTLEVFSQRRLAEDLSDSWFTEEDMIDSILDKHLFREIADRS